MKSTIHPKAKCNDCKGCYKLIDPLFTGLFQCGQFEKREIKAWCADETIKKFIKTRKIV